MESLPTKAGAGFLICCEGSCLLLKRSERSGNPGTWGIPGGNADSEDGGSLEETARRETREEIGELPPGMQVLGSVLTRRGKSLQKHYTVFIASIPGASRAHYQPTLNDEHTDWRWVDLRHAFALAGSGPGAHNHQHHAHQGGKEECSDEEGAAAVAGPPPGDVALHPVIRVLFGAHADGVRLALGKETRL